VVGRPTNRWRSSSWRPARSRRRGRRRGHGKRHVDSAAIRQVSLVITGLPAEAPRRTLQRSHFGDLHGRIDNLGDGLLIGQRMLGELDRAEGEASANTRPTRRPWRSPLQAETVTGGIGYVKS
jgi:hypothetical protein